MCRTGLVLWIGVGGFNSELLWVGLKKFDPQSTHQFHGSKRVESGFLRTEPTRPTKRVALDGPTLLAISKFSTTAKGYQVQVRRIISCTY